LLLEGSAFLLLLPELRVKFYGLENQIFFDPVFVLLVKTQVVVKEIAALAQDLPTHVFRIG
jgi:hypothetical protein